MSFSIKKSLSREIFIYILIVALLPSIIILYFSTKKLKKKLHDELIHKLYSGEKVVVSDLNRIIADLIKGVTVHSKTEFLIVLLEGGKDSIKGLRLAISYLKSSANVDMVSIFDVDGNLVASTDDGLSPKTIRKEFLLEIEKSEKKNTSFINGFDSLSNISNKGVRIDVFSPIVEPYYKYLQGVIMESIFLDKRFIDSIKKKIDIDIALFTDKNAIISTLSKGILSLDEKIWNDLIETRKRIEANIIVIEDDPYHLILMPFLTNNKVFGAIGLLGSEVPIHESIKNVHYIFVASIILIFVFAIFVAILSTRQIVKPIIQVVHGLDRIATGDMSYAIQLEKENEIGRLARSFNKMAYDLKETTVSRDFMDNIFRSMIDVVLIIDINGIIINTNEAIYTVYGYSKKELLGKSVTVLFIDDISGKFDDAIKELMNGNIVTESNLTIKAKSGNYLPISLSGSPIRDKEGAITGMVIVIKDMRELMTLVSDLEKTNKELKLTQANLIQAGKMAAMGQLTAGIAHELNQPLTGIKGFSQILVEDIRDNYQKNLLNKIVIQVDRMSKIIQNLRTFARQSAYEYKEMFITKCIDEAFSLFTQQLKERDINVKKLYDKDSVMVYGDFNQLQQVFINIISNAKDAMEDMKGKKEILVKSKYIAENNEVEIIFKDTGQGISPEIRAEIFNPFFTTKGVGKGTGLGLSISYGIIEKHCGKIELVSDNERGATFRIVLPIAGSARSKMVAANQDVFVKYPLGSLER